MKTVIKEIPTPELTKEELEGILYWQEQIKKENELHPNDMEKDAWATDPYRK